jgi:DNA-binding transcriptional MerR regulator
LTKSPLAFRTISEAATELGVPQHVLRFWETKFSFLKPMKRAGGRRFYRPQDVAVLHGVKALLYTQGYKIEGVQKLFRQHGLTRLLEAGDPATAALFVEETAGGAEEVTLPSGPVTDEAWARLRRVLEEVETAKARLDSILEQS